MSISSSFTDFSLAELFQLIDQGRKSGCLSVCTLPELYTPGSKSHYYYIWFRQGRIIAIANRLNGGGLASKIVQRGWVNPPELEQLCRLASRGTPLGVNLKTQEILTDEQLNLLFASQLKQVRELFEIQRGIFKLDSKATLPWKEMTGLSLRATEVALMALRILKNWDVMADALPSPDCAIQTINQTISKNQPQLHLNAFEWQVWEFANGTISLKAIANQLQQSTAQVQQAAFRLILAGLVEEVPVLPSTCDLKDYPVDCRWVDIAAAEPKKSSLPETPQISSAFLQNLVGYLRSKT